METVVVVDYDPHWPAQFDELRAFVWPAVADVALTIEHIGSTSVPGLAAKPIIDMTVVVASRNEVPLVTERLASLGYQHLGQLGIEDRDAFRQPTRLPHHHLYVCPKETIGIVNPLAVRDYLRAHPAAARAYGELKKQLAREFPNDVDSYTIGKTDMLLDILRDAGLTPAQLGSIEHMNRAPSVRTPENF
jgi:GrpB-like predicted nucleotidyltransferase (UPF0157 family)